jgi:hypothetical protein
VCGVIIVGLWGVSQCLERSMELLLKGLKGRVVVKEASFSKIDSFEVSKQF